MGAGIMRNGKADRDNVSVRFLCVKKNMHIGKGMKDRGKREICQKGYGKQTGFMVY